MYCVLNTGSPLSEVPLYMSAVAAYYSVHVHVDQGIAHALYGCGLIVSHSEAKKHGGLGTRLHNVTSLVCHCLDVQNTQHVLFRLTHMNSVYIHICSCSMTICTWSCVILIIVVG